MRHCEQCQTEFRPTHKSQRYCSLRCYGASREIPNPGPAAARKRAQRAIKATTCERCGATVQVQRHHEDLSKPLVVKVLCQNCHTAADVALGKWGSGTVKPRPCLICGIEFMPQSGHNRTKLCANPECLKELGRRSANRRWHRASAAASTACDASETQSCPSKPPSPSACCGSER